MANLIRQRKAHLSGLGGSHGAFKVRTQVPHAAPPHERLHQDSDLDLSAAQLYLWKLTK